MGEADIKRKTRMKAIADFLQKVLPEPSSPRTETLVKKKKKQPPPPPLPSRHFDVGTQTEHFAIPFTSAVYETPKPRFTFGELSDDDDNDDGDDNDVFVKGDARAFGRENVGPTACPYILP